MSPSYASYSTVKSAIRSDTRLRSFKIRNVRDSGQRMVIECETEEKANRLDNFVNVNYWEKVSTTKVKNNIPTVKITNITSTLADDKLIKEIEENNQ